MQFIVRNINTYMKQFLVVILVFGAFAALGQADTVFIWNKWCSRNDTLLLFMGSYNMIQVHSPTIKADAIMLKSLDKTLRLGTPEINKDTLSVLAMPYTTEKPMKLAVINSRTGKVLNTVFFTADEVPQPAARLGNLKDTNETKINILSQVRLKVFFPNSFYSYPYHVKSYTFKTKVNNTDVSIPVRGNMITRDVEAAIRQTTMHSVLEFTDIKVTCPECVTKEISPIHITVK
jgi:GldM C-terminal domain